MKFGVALTTAASPVFRESEQKDYLLEASEICEAKDYESVWVSDRTLYPADISQRYPEQFGPGKADPNSQNIMEALSNGATNGMKLAANVAAMLVAFVAIIAMVNAILGLLDLSLQQILGWIFSPLAWVMGVPWNEAGIIGSLMGEKLVLTELIAFGDLSKLMTTNSISDRSAIIASYALCGFANFASVGIQLGGIGGIAPERRKDLAKLGLKAMFGGALASWLTATIAGMLI